MAVDSSRYIASPCFLLYLLILPIIHAYSSSLSTQLPSPETICNFTPYPHFCTSMLLPVGNGVATVHDYGRRSLDHSLSATDNFLSLVNNYLKLMPRTFSEITKIRALEDCQLLVSLNKDFLAKTNRALRNTETLQSFQREEDIHTYLSATLTNHETCLDGLEEAKLDLLGIKDVLSSYSVSLALFLHGWAHHGLREGNTFEFVRSRKLSQAYNNNVKVRQMVVVNPNGSGNFTTIGAAVAAAPANAAASDGYFLIYIVAGVYEEYVTIGSKQRYIMMVGDGINRTIITGNRSVVDGWTTFKSATFAVSGEGFVAANITFRNTAGAAKHQAVAVRNGADLSTFYSCSFEGYQDTLYTHSLRQFYRTCDIYGTVDFIFGNAAAVLQNCSIYARLPLPNQFNAITAQGRIDINQNTGTSIHNCSIKPATDLANNGGGAAATKTYLGRPWKEYSKTVYMQSFMDGLIDAAGWVAWSEDFGLNTLYYGEYGNTGPGSVTSNRVKWEGYHVLGAAEAGNFTVSRFIHGDNWLPATWVPYAAGLI